LNSSKVGPTLCAVNLQTRTIHMIKDAVVSYRIPAELKAALQKLADADKRKLGPYIQIVLEEHVERRRSKPASKRK
jgi:hypothetical protein